MHKLHGHQLKPFLLEPLDDLANEAAMNTIRLDHDEGSLVVCRHFGGKISLASFDIFTDGQVRQG